jgi:hypothetical protein
MIGVIKYIFCKSTKALKPNEGFSAFVGYFKLRMLIWAFIWIFS